MKTSSTFSPPSDTPDSCPHCGRKLSPWEQVLLGVDRALMCKGCWYRILLDVRDQQPEAPPKTDQKKPRK